MVDRSAVVTRSDPDDWRVMLSFIHDLVSRFDLDSGRTRVAAIVYGDTGQVVFYLDTFNDKVCISSGRARLYLVKQYGL